MQTQKKALMRTRKRKIMNKEEKITLLTENGESLDFFVLEETRINGKNYLLVTDEEDERQTGNVISLRILPGTRRKKRFTSL